MSTYWEFNGRNALAGVEGVVEVLPDGRLITHPDPVNPAVLSAHEIIYALQTSRRARNDFRLVFPSLLTDEQARLTVLLEDNPRVSSLIMDERTFTDRIQAKEVKGVPIRTCGRRGGKGYGGGA